MVRELTSSEVKYGLHQNFWASSFEAFAVEFAMLCLGDEPLRISS